MERAKLQGRGFQVDLASRLGKTQVVTTSTPLNQQVSTLSSPYFASLQGGYLLALLEPCMPPPLVLNTPGPRIHLLHERAFRHCDVILEHITKALTLLMLVCEVLPCSSATTLCAPFWRIARVYSLKT